MRISMSSDDAAGYAEWVRLFHLHGDEAFDIKVRLDGQFIHNAIIADSDAGTCVCYKKTPDGKRFVMDGDEIATEAFHGKVEFFLHGTPYGLVAKTDTPAGDLDKPFDFGAHLRF